MKSENLTGAVVEAFIEASALIKKFPKSAPGLRSAHFRIINAIYHKGQGTRDLRVLDLCDLTKILPSNMTKYLNELVDMDIIVKVPDTTDKRVTFIRLTENGKKIMNEQIGEFMSRIDEEVERLGEAECRAMIDTMHKFCHACESAINR